MPIEVAPQAATLDVGWLAGAAALAVAVSLRLRRTLPHWTWSSARAQALRPAPFALEILVADRGRRHALEGELRSALGRLQVLLGSALPPHTSVVVLDTICQDDTLAGCTHIGERPGGSPYAIVCLALRVREQDLNADQVLSVLAEQCIALAARRDAGTTLVLPVELPRVPVGGGAGTGSAETTAREHGAPVRSDPLAAPVPLSPLAAYRGENGAARPHSPD